jgi:uncharacterized protein (TIGR02594 family)
MSKQFLEVMQSRIGIQEYPGAKNNPVILRWFAEIGHPEIIDETTSWCSVCASSAAIESGLPCPPVKVNMMARSWLQWGVKVKPDDIQPGDVAVWPRGNSNWQGHVNVVESVVGDRVICVGGNQSGLRGGDAVTRAKPRPISEALGFRRGVPATVKDLRKAGSTEIKTADTLEKAALVGVPIAGGVGKAIESVAAANIPVPAVSPEVTEALKSGAESIGFGQTLVEGSNAILGILVKSPWLFAVGVAAIALLFIARKLRKDRVKRAADGVPLSSQLSESD